MNFTTAEKLADIESWNCPTLKNRQPTTKKIDFWNLPNVIVVQLKRFSISNFNAGEKIDTFVEFPIIGLDIRPYIVNSDMNVIYDLIAVICFINIVVILCDITFRSQVSNDFGGLGGGHYTAYAKNITTEKW